MNFKRVLQTEDEMMLTCLFINVYLCFLTVSRKLECTIEEGVHPEGAAFEADAQNVHVSQI